jgi:hypothetical protein
MIERCRGKHANNLRLCTAKPSIQPDVQNKAYRTAFPLPLKAVLLPGCRVNDSPGSRRVTPAANSLRTASPEINQKLSVAMTVGPELGPGQVLVELQSDDLNAGQANTKILDEQWPVSLHYQ